MIAQASLGLQELLTLPALILGIILTVLLIMMPYYVYRIRKETATTNKLLRQLIRAYGHDPEG